MNDVSTFTKILPCGLSDIELIAKGEDLAAELTALEEAEAEAKADAQKHKETQAGIKDKIRKLRSAIEERQELRPVDCEERIDRVFGVARVFRLDTGEMVSERKLELDDVQADIFGETNVIAFEGKKKRGR